MSEPTNAEVLVKLAELEGRMNTMEERYDKGWALLREDMAKRDADAAKRETRMLLAMAAMIGLGIAILGFIG
ncbi:MAG: hypothetical protein OXF74_04300 [Rhodobacteraceae bacterium]|nr:hypothetical protein [Paracoccaceae bacterium]